MTFFRRTREDLSVETAPALWRTFFLMCLCFVLCGVALATFVLAIRPRRLENFSVKAAPPTCFAISDRLFFRRKPLSTLLSAFHVGHLDHVAVKAAPTFRWHAIIDRVFQCVV